MTQNVKLLYLINALLNEHPNYKDIQIPTDVKEQKQLLRSLMNVRPPMPLSDDIMQIQDIYLQSEITFKGITVLDDLHPVQNNLYLWQGDITTIKCDAIVNAANSEMLGCFCPCHGCIDNAIHTYSGVKLRLECAEIMSKQGYLEPIGNAKITSAFNLPCKYIIHTVGPIVNGGLKQKYKEQLASCYRSCLNLAENKGITSIAFCCISTGEYHFSNEEAAQIAINTVKSHINYTHSEMKVMFNVYKDEDYWIYHKLFGNN